MNAMSIYQLIVIAAILGGIYWLTMRLSATPSRGRVVFAVIAALLLLALFSPWPPDTGG